MQKGVLIKQGVDVVEKRVYAGDLSTLDQKLRAEGVDYQIFDDMDPIFQSATVRKVVSQESVEWKKLVTADDKVAYLARKLGLE